MVLNFAGHQFRIPASQYRWPAVANTMIGGVAGKCYIAIISSGESNGQGNDFVLGYNTLKHLHVVLDSENNRVGIAQIAII